jgi:hypothetical protein
VATPDPDTLIDEHWPIDGPHGPGSVASAAAAVAHLVRYLNHATRSTNAHPSGPDLSSTLNNLATAVQRLPQLLQQLEANARWVATDATLYDDRGIDPSRTARDAGDELLSAARTVELLLQQHVDAAAQDASHLGHHDSGDSTP